MVSILCLSPAQAAEPGSQALEFKGIYDFTITNIPIGKMGIAFSETPTAYSITSDIVTTGLVNMIVKHQSHTTVHGTGSNFAYPNWTYETHYQTRKKKKYVKMISEGGQVTQNILVPPDNPVTRTPVADDMKKNVVDPLSLTLHMRQQVWKAMQNHESKFMLHMYDGRRLTEIDFVIGEKQMLPYQGKSVTVIPVSITRRMLAGFTQQEIADSNPNEPVVRAFFTDDARMMLIRAEAPLWMGVASANLVKECKPEENCLLGLPAE